MTLKLTAQLAVLAALWGGMFVLALPPSQATTPTPTPACVPAPHTPPTPPPAPPQLAEPLASVLAHMPAKADASTRQLYTQAAQLGVLPNTFNFTKYHQNEGSIGGGKWTRDHTLVRPGVAACAGKYWKHWHGHVLWVENWGRVRVEDSGGDWGRVRVEDSGGGWSTRYRFDLAAFTVHEARTWGGKHGGKPLQTVVVLCPRPE